MLVSTINTYIEKILAENYLISEERKDVLKQLARYIQNTVKDKKGTNLIFICTHNSRRSHMGQLWAQAASIYYNISNVNCYSGGTEATAFNYRSVKALQKAGFEIIKGKDTENTSYKVIYSAKKEPIAAFSKKFSHKENPQKSFAAIMTCSDADEACPFVPGADARFSVKYDDPKAADNSPEEEVVYDTRCKQIANEMLYLFSKVKQQ